MGAVSYLVSARDSPATWRQGQASVTATLAGSLRIPATRKRARRPIHGSRGLGRGRQLAVGVSLAVGSCRGHHAPSPEATLRTAIGISGCGDRRAGVALAQRVVLMRCARTGSNPSAIWRLPAESQAREREGRPALRALGPAVPRRAATPAADTALLPSHGVLRTANFELRTQNQT